MRNFTYVGDMAPATARIIRRPEAFDRIYNIGSNEAVTVEKLAGLVAEAMDVKPCIRTSPSEWKSGMRWPRMIASQPS